MLFAVASVSAWADNATWLVTSIKGDVRVRSLDASWKLLVIDQKLDAGTEIETTPGSKVILKRGDDTVIVSPGSAFEIGPNGNSGNADATEAPSIIQKLGTLLFKIESRAGIDRFRVRTPYLAAVIKGTIFSVSVTPEGSALHVTEGLVEVASPATGQVGLVGVGQTARVSAQGGSPLTIDNGRGEKKSPPSKADDKQKSEAPNDNKNANQAQNNNRNNGLKTGLKIGKPIDVGIGSIARATKGLISALGANRGTGANENGGRSNGSVGRNAVAGSNSNKSLSVPFSASLGSRNGGAGGNAGGGGGGVGGSGGNGSGGAGSSPSSAGGGGGASSVGTPGGPPAGNGKPSNPGSKGKNG